MSVCVRIYDIARAEERNMATVIYFTELGDPTLSGYIQLSLLQNHTRTILYLIPSLTATLKSGKFSHVLNFKKVQGSYRSHKLRLLARNSLDAEEVTV